MTSWRPQQFREAALADGHDQSVIANAMAIANEIRSVNPALPPIFTLSHLASLTGNEYEFLRSIIKRDEPEPYRRFSIRKKPSADGTVRFRIITVPHAPLMRTQRWIAQSILALGRPHHASVAFSKGDTIYDAAKLHCGCRWLIKMDLRNFFESISEIAVYRVFRSIGYQPLVSFEMTRLCTRLGGRSALRSVPRWQRYAEKWTTITDYRVSTQEQGPAMGHLPQGAPSSPMLANLAMRDFDSSIEKISNRHGLRYTRYADDITLSTKKTNFSRIEARQIIGQAYAEMGKFGLSPNVAKTRVSTPGARKVVLGLLVDREIPRLSREFKQTMRLHIHCLTHPSIGPIEHARRRGFNSVIGFKHHLQGLLAFAHQIEPLYAQECKTALAKINWPL
jgi:retron-type reverse transcriptase